MVSVIDMIFLYRTVQVLLRDKKWSMEYERVRYKKETLER